MKGNERQKIKLPTRALAVLLSVLMLVTYIPFSVLAANSDVESITFKNVSADLNYALSNAAKNYSETLYEAGDAAKLYQEYDAGEYTITIGGKDYTVTANDGSEKDSLDVTISKKSDDFPPLLFANVTQNLKDKITSWTVADSNETSITSQLRGTNFSFALSTLKNTVTVTPIKPIPTYTVTLPVSTPDFTVNPSGEQTVTAGGEQAFTVTAVNPALVPVIFKSSKDDSGILSHEEPQSGNTYSYKLTNVNADYTLQLSSQPKTVNVTISGYDPNTMTSAELAAWEGKTTVNYGSNLTFQLAPEPGYPLPTVTYTGNGQGGETTIKPVVNSFTIVNVTQDVQIQIKGGTKTEYTVSYPVGGENLGYTAEAFSDGDQKITNGKIVYGKTLTYKVTVKKNYNNSTPHITANVGYTVTGPEDSNGDKIYTYTFTNVTQNISITVSGLSLNQYTVKLPDSTTMYTVTATSDTATATRSFTFTITLLGNYSYSKEAANIVTSFKGAANKSVTVNGKVYTVTLLNVNGNIEDIVIDDENITIPQFTVHAPTPIDGYTFQFSDEQQEDKTVEYGSDISFKVTPTGTNQITSVTYQTSKQGAELPLQATGANGDTYTIQNVQSECWINVHVRKRYTVTLPESTDKYTVNKETTTLTAGSDFTFTVTLEKGWKLTPADAKQLFKEYESFDGANVTVTVSGNSVYLVSVKSIAKDWTFTVNESNLEEIKYKVTDTSGDKEGYKLTITTNQESGWDGEAARYGSNVAFTVVPDPGYYIQSVYVQRGKNADSELATSNGENAYIIRDIDIDCMIFVNCKPIEVTVTYNVPKVEVNGITLASTSDTLTYSVKAKTDKKELATLNVTKDDFSLSLNDPAKRGGLQCNGWEQVAGVATKKITLDPNVATQRITLTANYTVIDNTQTDHHSAPFSHSTATEPTSTPIGEDGVKSKVSFAASVKWEDNISAEDKRALEAGNYKITAYGMLLAQNDDELTTPEEFEQAIRALRAESSDWLSGQNNIIYCYYHVNTEAKGLKLGGTYTQTVNVKNGQHRYAVFFFKVQIGNTEYILFTEQKTYTGTGN